MGLDLHVATSDGAEAFASRIGSYHGFHDFRTAWAKLLGFDLDEMDGFNGDLKWTTQPLQCFFRHSDCEGEISHEDAKSIWERALIDAPKLPDWHHKFEVLIMACAASVREQMPIVFR